MLPSPLQLKELKFLSVRIEPRIEPDIRDFASPNERYDFAGARLVTTVEHVWGEEIEEAPSSEFLLAVRIQLPNEGDNPPPYLVDVKCMGHFSIAKTVFPEFEKRYDVGVVNAASMVYGSIRELVASQTARSFFGELLLPSGNFIDNAPSKSDHEEIPLSPREDRQQEKVIKKRPAKARNSKKD